VKHVALALVGVLGLCTPRASAQEKAIVIRAARVLDGKGDVLTNVALVIQGSRIVRIDRNVQQATYDLGEMTVMPGWIDTHAHITSHFDRETGRAHSAETRGETPQQAMLYAVENAHKILMSGFTTVQSPGAPLDKDLRDWIADGRVPGPRILTSLRSITGNTGTPDQIRAFVRTVVKEGADFVKVFATGSIREGGAQTMTDDQIRAACDEARALGKRTLVHAQGPEGARAAVLAGCTAIEHGNRLTDEVLDLMAARGTYFDSNNHLLIHNYLEHRSRYLGVGNFTEEGFAYMEKGLAPGNDTFKRALAKRVKMVFGTDATAGALGRQFEELIYRVKDGGQNPMDAIVTATSKSAESMGLGNTVGIVAPGMEADLIATDGDPIQDITAVRRVMFVMKGGKVFRNEPRASAR
jgi:imidazolonepropionase-like amidohydrolase